MTPAQMKRADAVCLFCATHLRAAGAESAATAIPLSNLSAAFMAAGFSLEETLYCIQEGKRSTALRMVTPEGKRPHVYIDMTLLMQEIAAPGPN